MPVPHAGRFRLVWGALFALGAVAIALSVVVVVSSSGSDSGTDDEVAWSGWQPGVEEVPAGAQQIAEHVAPRYRLPTGEQLVAVSGGALEVGGVETQIAKRAAPAAGGEISLLDGDGVLYRMCGLGAQCAIRRGEASAERSFLLRREALELALYSFRYLRGVDDVTVLMPPRKGQAPSMAVHFSRDDLGAALDQPLAATLQPETPGVSTVTRSPDAVAVERLTSPRLWCFSLTQANADTRAFLVLDPLPASAQPCPGAKPAATD